MAGGDAARSARPRVLVARPVFEEVVARLRQVAEVEWLTAPRQLTPEVFRARLREANGAFVTGGERIDAALLAECRRLKVISTMTVGYDHIDVAACRARGVVVTHTPDVLTETTADFGIALLLAAARQVTAAERFLRAGAWRQWRYDLFAGADVHGTTLGILGMGRIGQAIARRAARGFDMRVHYHNRHRLPRDLERELGAEYHDFDELLRDSQHLLLALPYSPQAHHLIGARELSLLPRGATLVNIARGGLIDEPALAAALTSGHLGAAGLDVFEGEPQVNPALLSAPRVVLTPHIASASSPTRRAMAMLAADNLIAVLEGRPPPTPVPASEAGDQYTVP